MPAVGFQTSFIAPSIQHNPFSHPVIGSPMQPTYAANSATNIESLGNTPDFVAKMKDTSGPVFRENLRTAKQEQRKRMKQKNARKEKSDHARKCINKVTDLKKMANMINSPEVKNISPENTAQNLETYYQLERAADVDCQLGLEIPLNSEKCTTSEEAELTAEITYNNIINVNHQIKMENKRNIFAGEVNVAVGEINNSGVPVPGEGFLTLDANPDWETPIPGLLKDVARCKANIALAENLNTTLYQRFTHELTTLFERCPLVIKTGQELLRAANKMV